MQACAQHFAVVLDNQLITVPYIDYKQNLDGIDSSINGSEITGSFTITSAQNLANELRSGALPLKLDLISSSLVSATLGKQALNQGLVAGIVGFIIVALFLLIFYRVLGIIAVGALVVYGVYFFALVKLIPITLTLPGIAGLILTIGVAADANIVIFERIKEEIRGGKSIAAGITSGYRRGIAAIADANFVTFITAFILFALATAGVKGFALVLGIGTLVSLFTAVLATQAVLGTLGQSRLLRSRQALGAGEQKRVMDVRLHGRVEVVLLGVGRDPAHRRAGDRQQGPELRHRLRVGHADHRRVREEGRREHGPRRHERAGPRRRGDPAHQQQQGAGRQRVPDLDALPEGPQAEPGDHGARQRAPHPRHPAGDVGRPDVRPVGRQRRDQGDHPLAARDLDLHRAAVRVEVRGAGADRPHARPADHGGRLRAHSAGR